MFACIDVDWGGACKTFAAPLDQCTRFDSQFTKQVSSMRTLDECVQCKGTLLTLSCLVPPSYRGPPFYRILVRQRFSCDVYARFSDVSPEPKSEPDCSDPSVWLFDSTGQANGGIPKLPPGQTELTMEQSIEEWNDKMSSFNCYNVC